MTENNIKHLSLSLFADTGREGVSNQQILQNSPHPVGIVDIR
jgi:hypothetical protein